MNGCFKTTETPNSKAKEGEHLSLSKVDDSHLASAISSYFKIGDYEQLSVKSEDFEGIRDTHKKWRAKSNVVNHYSVEYMKENNPRRVNISILKYTTEQDAMAFLNSYESSAKGSFKENNKNAEAKEENDAVSYRTEKNGNIVITNFTRKVENGVSTFTDQFDGEDGLSFYRKIFCKKNFCFQVTEGELNKGSSEEYLKLLADIDKIIFTFTEKI